MGSKYADPSTERAYRKRSAEVEAALSSLGSPDVVLPEREAVREYFLRHPDMSGPVKHACTLSRERLGAGPQLSLEVYRDPEIEDEYLALFVRQEEYDEQVLDIIESISEQHREELAETSGWLLVTTDFCPPR